MAEVTVTRRVKLAVVGASLTGKGHIQHVLAEPSAQLSAVVDPTPVGETIAKGSQREVAVEAFLWRSFKHFPMRPSASRETFRRPETGCHPDGGPRRWYAISPDRQSAV